MHVLIDIGNSTIVIALANSEGNITATWRFKTKKEETASFFRYELKQGLRKYGVETSDVEKVTISSVVPEVNDDIAQAVVDLTGITPHFFSIVIDGSCEARLLRALRDVFTPGIMMPPLKTLFSSIIPIVVAVPKSITMAGTP